MNDNLIQLFSVYKSTIHYKNSFQKINLDWLNTKLCTEDLKELKNQIYATLLETEEEIFIGSLKYAWGLQQELSKNDD